MKAKLLLLAIVVFATGISADAQIKQKARMQQHRIHSGVNHGQITSRERRELNENRREIHDDVKLAKADGKISARERKIIAKEQRKQSHDIYRKKHNRRVRH